MFALTTTDPKDEDIRRWAPWLFVMGLAMAVAQIITAQAVGHGTRVGSCHTNEQCLNSGVFCAVRTGTAGQCQFCDKLIVGASLREVV
eukprot:SAG22_NODE_11738_length_471_cov_1.086022_1_plen_87_part_10